MFTDDQGYARQSGACLQFLPIGPTGFGDSPYQLQSVFAGNPLLIDLDSLAELGLLTQGELNTLCGLPREYVDYGQLIPLKTRLLVTACKRFDRTAPPDLKLRRDEYLHENFPLWLRDYSLYRVLKSLHGERAWTEWEPACSHREPAAVARIEAKYARQIQRIGTGQFLFDWQWRAMREYAREQGIVLFGDMPIYLAMDSADAWSNPDLLQIGGNGRPECVAGVPPDYFSADGQFWGNPLYDWPHHAATGYRWWTSRLRQALKFADQIRIDHFRGFESYWAIPADATSARNGSWLAGPGDAFFAAIRSALGGLPVVAEDLGDITPEVEALRDRQQLPGMQVLQFMVADPDFSPGQIREHCVLYTGTHDNDTTVGWFHGGAGDTRTPLQIKKAQSRVLRVTGGTADTVHTDMIRLAFASRAELAVAPMQDFLGLGSEARLNTPGTMRNNWRWRLGDDQPDAELSVRIARLVDDASRG